METEPNNNKDLLDVSMDITNAQKAVIQAILCSLKCKGQAYSSLSEAIIDSIRNCGKDLKTTFKANQITVLAEVDDSTENLKALFDRHAPAKLRGVKLSSDTLNYIKEVSNSFKGEWVITKDGEVVREFDFDDDKLSRAKQTIGTTLYHLVTSRFKTDTDINSLDAKIRGKFLKPGDYAKLTMFFLMLTTPTSGKALRLEFILNFVSNTASGGISESYDLEEGREKEDPSQDMGEDLDQEIDDYDDYER